jgi:REP element-mobilizing transposase RayT
MLAYHIIFSAYGFWLPNDPRGSWSDFVGSWELLRFGKATKVHTRRSVAGVPHDRGARKAAKLALKHPPVRFNGREALAVGRGFARACREGEYRLHACSILPEHVHLDLACHPRSPTRIVGHLKGRATQRLISECQWPAANRPAWAAKCWKVFLDTPDDVARAVAYVEANPEKESLPRQRWSFVVPVTW